MNMANIQERRDKSGKLISYSIRVHRGRDANGKQLKPWTTTFDVKPTWTEKALVKKQKSLPLILNVTVKRALLQIVARHFRNTASTF